MVKLMTIDKIEAQFDSEWVLVKDPQTNDALEIQMHVVSHKDRIETFMPASIARAIAVEHDLAQPLDSPTAKVCASHTTDSVMYNAA